MNIRSILTLVALLFLYITCWRWYTCKIKNFCSLSDFSIGSTSKKKSTPIQFYDNTDTYLLDGFESFRESICILSRTKNIEIIGYYNNTELNNTAFENLGIARAEKLKQLLAECIDTAAIINIRSEVKVSDNTEEDPKLASEIRISERTIMNPNEVQITTTNGITEIRFPEGSDKEIQDEKLNAFLEDVSKNSKSKKIKLTGHTDNVGNENSNVTLSLNRCITIKNLLIKMGVPEANISCDGLGSQSPKVDNTTPENRALNRRVELVIQ